MAERRYGTLVPVSELGDLGFIAFDLRFRPEIVPTPLGPGTDWDTVGDPPAGPGLYLFTTEDPSQPSSLRVLYVGLTKNLWMVAKGQLPGQATPVAGSGTADPSTPGQTRQRINIDIARARHDGLEVRHWMKPMTIPDGEDVDQHLRRAEEEMILGWALRTAGWNRG